MMHRLANFFALMVVCVACQGNNFENEATRGLPRADKVQYQQYMIQGQQLYSTHCSNCHQDDGSGLGKLIPPLAQSDYLLADVDRTLCLIKNGVEGELVVNGVSYNQAMPGNEQLRDIEIAQIATYIYNHWGHARGPVSTKQVKQSLSDCDSTTALP